MEFWMERTASHSHRAAIGFTPPPGVTIKQIPAEKSIGGMMLSGELQAVIHYIVNPNLVDRSTADLWRHPDIKPLFSDPLAEGVRYFRAERSEQEQVEGSHHATTFCTGARGAR